MPAVAHAVGIVEGLVIQQPHQRIGGSAVLRAVEALGGQPDLRQELPVHAGILGRQRVQIVLHRVGRLPVPLGQRVHSALGIRAVRSQIIGAQIAEGTRLPVRHVLRIIHDAVIRRIDADGVVVAL